VTRTDRDFDRALGARIRRERDQAGITADGLARAARDLGLRWQRSTLASIEIGRRAVTAPELLLLPLIFQRAGREIRLIDLLDGPMRLSESVTATEIGFAQILKGAEINRLGGEAFVMPAIAAESKRLLAEVAKVSPLLPDATFAQLVAAIEDGRSDAEQRAGRELGRTAVEVAHAARRLWSRSLTAEREARAQQLVGPDATPTVLRAARRRVARALIEQLEAALGPREA
jgi:transcriptional regulator with XRE-family HTH domain